MRRIFQSKKHKRHSAYRGRKVPKARYLYKKWRAEANKTEQNRRSRARKKTREAYDPSFGYKIVLAPNSFSFITDPERVSKFISELKDHYKNNRRVFIRLRNVQIIDYSAIVVLLSIMVRFKSKGIHFNGDFPKNQNADKILRNSGFLQNLMLDIEDAEKYEIKSGRGDGIFTHSWKMVDSSLSATLIEQASMTICGNPLMRPGVQRSMIELMMNTHNHADRSERASKHWWVSVHHDKAKRRVSFSFVDYGIGVFRSLDNKSMKSKFFNWQNKISGKLTYSNNADFLRKILNGELHATVTGKHFRGKGLPGIRQVMARNKISNLHVITNDVYANVQKDEFRVLKFPFEGTFVYWEVGEENER